MTIHDIQQLVAQHFGVRLFDLMSSRRDRPTARPRQVAMWISKQATHHGVAQIGRAFDRDHSTVMAAIRRIDALMAADAEFARTVNALRELVA